MLVFSDKKFFNLNLIICGFNLNHEYAVWDTLLRSLRDKVKTKRDKGELFDTARFTRHMEAAYAQMWQRWLAGEPPQAFAVKPD